MQEFKKQVSFSLGGIQYLNIWNVNPRHIYWFMELLVAAAVQFISDNQLCQPDVLNLGNNKTTHLWLNFSADNVYLWPSTALLIKIHTTTKK